MSALTRRASETLRLIEDAAWAIEVSELARLQGISSSWMGQICGKLVNEEKIRLFSGDETEMFAQAIGPGHARTGLCSCAQCVKARDKDGAIWKAATK